MNPSGKMSESARFRNFREVLQQDIKEGKFKLGALIPEEGKLAEDYDVSVMSARQAIADLCKDGILNRKHGRGIFVTEKRIERDFTRLVSFSEHIRRRGLIPTTKVLKMTVEYTNPEIASKLKISKKDLVVCLERLRLVDGIPIVILKHYIPTEVCPHMMQTDMSEYPSLFEFFKEHGVIMKRAVQYVEMRSADPLQAELLNLETGDLLVHMERITYGDDSHPVEYVETFEVPETFSCTMEFAHKD
ncbi:MAG: GntR family transcriptional regulator [Anaerolineaceae bacterium]|nr:GntR family transcriptional regulator [Anaerolineaceae bacterium]